MDTPAIVSGQEWESALQEMLVKEKQFTHARDALAAMRRRMPWTRVEKSYEFEGLDGKLSLLDLFDGSGSSSSTAPSSTLAFTGGPSTDVSGAH